MRRFIVAFGHTIHTFGLNPFHRAVHSPEFVVLFGREERPGEWT